MPLWWIKHDEVLVGEKSFTVPLPVPLLWAGIKPISVRLHKSRCDSCSDGVAVSAEKQKNSKNRTQKIERQSNCGFGESWNPYLKKLQISTLERKSPKMTKKIK